MVKLAKTVFRTLTSSNAVAAVVGEFKKIILDQTYPRHHVVSFVESQYYYKTIPDLINGDETER